MSHYRRTTIPGGVYFFTVVTQDRVAVFSTETRVDLLRRAFRKVRRSKPFLIDAMVVLPDHLHCIWRLPHGDGDYSGRWREIKKAVSGEIAGQTNARNERQVWQRRFWEHAIRDQRDWRRHMDYIHYNPVKHGLVEHPMDWPWSSLERCVMRGWYEATWGEAQPSGIVGMECE